ncbi:MAG: adenylate/guanylate cyclase domain-containing protein [Leptospiraceae bacterium]|nr:adenylate/guanylate cyclase domain-containing protein [Leptospiraceae bacterium]
MEGRLRSDSIMNFLSGIIYKIIGQPRYHSLEHRLFSTITFVNGLSNVLGSFTNLLNLENGLGLFLLNFITGILFFALYFFSRFRSIYHSLYWPLMLLIFGFLSMNIIGNAGSQGGAHYYLIPALVIGVILSRNWKTTVAVSILAVVVTLGLFAVERLQPEWIKAYANPTERWEDVLGQYMFVQIFTGVLVIILAANFHDEREKSESLLRNTLPLAIAEELKREQKVQPRHYDDVTVLFTDFKGFTQIAESLSPQELVSELDQCFRSFDEIIKGCGLEKIKTIGDAYMAAGGIPEESKDHAVRTIQAALEMLAFMDRWKEQKEAAGKPSWEIRIGIHSGPLVAGVIGTEKFAYDVWGDTVNLASRMESSGAPGRVNISGQTYEKVKRFFSCEHRGQIQAKNKGEVDMYFVDGILPHLRDSDDPLKPNFLFESQLLDLARHESVDASKGRSAERREALSGS